MKHSFIRIMSILIAFTCCPVTQAGTVFEDGLNLVSAGEYDREKKRREEKLRERVEEERRENQRKLNEEICKSKREEIKTIDVLLEKSKSQIKKLISFEDKVFSILNLIHEIVQKIEQNSKYLDRTKTISKENQEVFNHYINTIIEADLGNPNLDEINTRFNHLIQISKDENMSLTELLEAALKNTGQTEILLLGNALRNSTLFLNEMITNEFSHYLEHRRIFESKTGSRYQNTIAIELIENRYVLVKKTRDKKKISLFQFIMEHGKSVIPECEEKSIPPPPPPPPPERVERPFRHNSFMY